MPRGFKVFIVTAFGVAALCILLYTISSAAEPRPAQPGLESELDPASLSVKELRQYVGTLGPRAFFIEGSILMYEREGRPKRTLVPMGRDLFGLEDAGHFRIRFTRDARGIADGVIGMYDNGSPPSTVQCTGTAGVPISSTPSSRSR